MMKDNNKGFALVTVVIVMAVLMIFGTTILAVSV